MAFGKALTALATLEAKLRRALGLAGEIGATFKPELIPVLIAGDLREPGNSGGFAGRSWSWAKQQIGAAGQYGSVRFDNEMLVKGIWMGGPAAQINPGICYLTIPGQSPAVAVSQNAGTWIDQRTLAVDLVPITETPAFAGITGTAESATNQVFTLWLGGTTVYFPLNLYLPAGSALNFKLSAGGSYVIGCHGRVWP